MGPDWLKFLVMNIFLYFSDSLGKGQATKSDEFSESKKVKLIQNRNFRVQGMFFQQL